ncbi:MAG: ATPase, partial [Bacteroidales bacterium]|nr:ATPase [Bacteroidales bacterium]
SFWVREEKNSQAEVDFLYKTRYGTIPIEVKAGHNAHLKSLQLFMQKTSCRSAVRFWCKPSANDTIELPDGKKFTLHNLPYYYSGQLGANWEKVK